MPGGSKSLWKSNCYGSPEGERYISGLKADLADIWQKQTEESVLEPLSLLWEYRCLSA
jgi:hypothetical protein